jgi:hypothetical protein
MLFDMVDTLGGGFSTTLGAGPSTLCAVLSICVAGWFVRMLVSCRMALTCFAFAVADFGIFPPSTMRRSAAARMERSFCNWNLAVGWVEAPRFGEAEVSCCGSVESETSIMVVSRAYVVAVRGMGRP